VATSGSFIDLSNKPTTLSGYGITNGMSTSHPANVINATDITHWNTAYGWGNHSGLYRPISYVPAWSEINSKPNTLSGYGITDAMNTSHAANVITNLNITNWNTAYGWGNHASAGYMTSENDPQIGDQALNYIPRWDGSKLIQGPFMMRVVE